MIISFLGIRFTNRILISCQKLPQSTPFRQNHWTVVFYVCNWPLPCSEQVLSSVDVRGYMAIFHQFDGVAFKIMTRPNLKLRFLGIKWMHLENSVWLCEMVKGINEISFTKFYHKNLLGEIYLVMAIFCKWLFIARVNISSRDSQSYSLSSSRWTPHHKLSRPLHFFT